MAIHITLSPLCYLWSTLEKKNSHMSIIYNMFVKVSSFCVCGLVVGIAVVYPFDFSNRTWRLVFCKQKYSIFYFPKSINWRWNFRDRQLSPIIQPIRNWMFHFLVACNWFSIDEPHFLASKSRKYTFILRRKCTHF